MADSHSAARELAFRVRLLTGLAFLGGVVGGLLYVGYLSDWRDLSLLQYVRLLRGLLFGDLYLLRQELLLSAGAGALLLTLPVIVFYVRRALAAGK
jgi:hypothetical protein